MAQQLAAGDVDRDEERHMGTELLLPLRKLPRRLVEDEKAERSHQAVAFGQRQEFARGHAAMLRMIPADLRLEAGDGAILQADDGPIEHLGLLAAYGAAKIGLERQRVRA